MNINVVYDQLISSLPAGFVAAINQVVAYFDHLYTNNINVTIDVGYGTFDGGQTVQPLGVENSSLGSQTNDVYVSYTTLRNALIAHGTSADDALANSNLPVNDPYFGGDNTSLLYRVQGAEARALGLLPANGNGSIDAWVGFMAQGTSGAFFTFDPNNRASPNANTYDFFGTAFHEFSHALGRVSDVATPNPELTPLDLFRYDSNGRQAGNGAPAYFSLNGGLTNLDNYATSSDQGDWASTATNDANLAGSPPNAVNWFTPTDVRQLDILGYTRAPAPATDLNGDGVSDILWQNTSGTVVMWEMQETQVVASAAIGGGGGWTVAGTGDFNGDGTSDILWQNTNGTVVMWEMNGTQVASSAVIGGGGGWTVAGTGDFNGDGKSDILWQNTNGAVVMWEMNGTQVIGSAAEGGGGGWSPLNDRVNNGAVIGDINVASNASVTASPTGDSGFGSANMPFLVNYLASTFADSSSGVIGTPLTNMLPDSSSQPQFLTSPHA